MLKEITIAIPALNEAGTGTIADIIQACKNHSDDVLVIDGHSTDDDTLKIARGLDVRVIFDHGKGKGEAIRSAIPHLKRLFFKVLHRKVL